MDERPPKNTTAAGPAGHALCAEDETGQDGEADGDEGRGGDDEGVTVTVWTPALCIPDTLDRHIYFPLQ